MQSRHRDAMPSRLGLGWVAAMSLVVSPGCKDDSAPGVQTVAAKREVPSNPNAPNEMHAQPETPETSSSGAQGVGDPPPPTGITTDNLTRFIPEEVRGVRRQLVGDASPDQPMAAASYEIVDDAGRRFVNINLKKVQDLDFEKAQFRVKDGEERQVQDSALLGKRVGGRLAQRSYSHSTESSEVTVLVEDAIAVRVSVEKAKDPDEPFEILSVIDLDGLASIVE